MTSLKSSPKPKKPKFPLALYRVKGQSMLPAFKPGDVVMAWRWGKLRPGQVVVARLDKPVIKRLTRLWPEEVWLAGDNPEASTDSRSLGAVPRHNIEAVVIAKF